GLAVRNGIELVEQLPPARLKYPNQQRILAGVIACRLGERHPVVRMVAEAHAEAIGLYPVVPLSLDAGAGGGYAGQQAAGRLPGYAVGVHGFFEVMTMLEHAGLYAVPMLVVLAACFPAHVVAYTRSSHQVPLIGRVDEHRAPEPATAQ